MSKLSLLIIRNIVLTISVVVLAIIGRLQLVDLAEQTNNAISGIADNITEYLEDIRNSSEDLNENR